MSREATWIVPHMCLLFAIHKFIVILPVVFKSERLARVDRPEVLLSRACWLWWVPRVRILLAEHVRLLLGRVEVGIGQRHRLEASLRVQTIFVQLVFFVCARDRAANAHEIIHAGCRGNGLLAARLAVMVDYRVESGRDRLLLVVVVDYAVVELVQDAADLRPVDLILRRVVVDRLVKGKREVFAVNVCTLVVIGQIFLFLIMCRRILFIVHSDALVLRVGFVAEPHHLQLGLLVLNWRTGSGPILGFGSRRLELRHKLFLLRV